MTTERDKANQLATAERKGEERVREETACAMKARGFSVEDICAITGLTAAELEKL